jgi:hypothetical protein
LQFVILQTPDEHVPAAALLAVLQFTVVAESTAPQAVALLATQLLPAAVPDRW